VRRINVTEAAIVRRIFTRAVAGAGYARIARELTQEGVPAPRGPQWAPNSVRGILTNPIYFGGPTYYGKKMLRNRWGKKNKGTCLRPSSEWTRVPAGCDPLVTEATWHAAAALRAGKVAKMKAAGPRGGQLRDGDSRYLLSNFARCAVCGGPICAIGRDVGGGRAYFYACMNYHRRGRLFCTNATTVPVDKLNAEVLTALVKLVDHPGLIGRVIKAVIKMRTNGVRAATVTRLQADLVRLEGERERLVAACALGGDVTAFHAGVQEREHRLAALRAQVATLQQPMTGSDPALAKAVRQEFARWTGLITGTLPDARSFLRRMLAGPILLTPAPGDVLLPRHRNQFGPRKDTRAYQFEGRLALDTHFSGLATIRGAGTHSAEDWKPTFKGIAA
jgi:hypothetical protein